MSILDTITRDLDWREKEIATMRLLLSSTGITNGQRQVLLRAAWAMLYAHYEGFCKNTLTTFYNVITESRVTCQNLPESTKLLALGDSLKTIRNQQNKEALDEIVNFQSRYLSAPAQFPNVDTQSNLWPSVLVELLEAADITIDKVKQHEIKLKTLVSRRNQIAHGENNFIAEVDYYHTFENAVYDVMYDLAFQVDSRLSLPPYAPHQQLVP